MSTTDRSLADVQREIRKVFLQGYNFGRHSGQTFAEAEAREYLKRWLLDACRIIRTSGAFRRKPRAAGPSSEDHARG